MNDLISREAAIEAIIKSKELTPGFMGMELYTEEDALDAINSVPSAQQWIPCSERLPDKEEFYLTFGDKGYINILSWCDGWNCHIGYDGKVCREFEIKHIIAWQPLPEPYVEVEK